MHRTLTRPAIDLDPTRASPRLALALALLAIPGSTLAWSLPIPAGGFVIGLPLALAAILVAVAAQRQRGSSKTTTIAIAIASLAIGVMVACTLIFLVA